MYIKVERGTSRIDLVRQNKCRHFLPMTEAFFIQVTEENKPNQTA